jgi:hypothetical protein
LLIIDVIFNGKCMSENILKYLRTQGEQLDADISKALKIPKVQLEKQLSELLTAGAIICCHVTRFSGEKKIEGMSYRLSAHVPPRAPGRKPGGKAKAAAATEDADED